MNHIEIRAKLEKAIEVRESGNLVESATLFEELVKRVKKSDGKMYMSVMAEYVIQIRLEGKNKSQEALKLGESFWKEYPEDINAIRAYAHSLIDLGMFEEAEILLRKLMGSYPDNSLREGEVQAHLASVLIRIGKLGEASELVEQAIDNIRKNTNRESYLEVRESHALLTKALVHRMSGEIVQAKKSVEEALEVAKRGKAVFRIRQAEEILKLFN